MKRNKELKTYSQVIALRDAFKPITQISWSIKNLERKFDIENLSQEEYNTLRNMYETFFIDVESCYERLKTIIEPKE